MRPAGETSRRSLRCRPPSGGDYARGGSTGKGRFRMAMPTFTMRQLLEAGVHFGHHTRRWNPKMGQYIFGVRNGVHIIDLGQTVPLLQQGIEAIRGVAASGGRGPLVGTHRHASTEEAGT